MQRGAANGEQNEKLPRLHPSVRAEHPFSLSRDRRLRDRNVLRWQLHRGELFFLFPFVDYAF
jgi:hypothetical protein